MESSSSNHDQPPAAWLWQFVVLSAVWGAAFLFLRLAVVEFGVIATAMLRAAIGALSLLPLVMFQGDINALRQRWFSLLLVGVLGSSIPSACLSFALLSISSGLTSIFNATVPLFGAVLGSLFLNQKPRRGAAAGFVFKVVRDTFDIKLPQSDDVLEVVLRDSIPSFTATFSPKAFQALADNMLRTGQIDKRVDTSVVLLASPQ